MLLLCAGDVAQMSLPGSMQVLNLWKTGVTGACEEDPHPRASVTRKKELRPVSSFHVHTHAPALHE